MADETKDSEKKGCGCNNKKVRPKIVRNLVKDKVHKTKYKMF